MNESIHKNKTNKNNNIIQLKKTHDPIITVHYVSRFQKKIYVFNNIGNYDEIIRRLLKKIEKNQTLLNNELDDLYKHFSTEQIQKWIQYSKKYVLSFVNEYIYQDDQIHIIRKKLMIHLSNPNENKYLLENNQQIWYQSVNSISTKSIFSKLSQTSKKNKNQENQMKRKYHILGYYYDNFNNKPVIYNRDFNTTIFETDGSLKNQYTLMDTNTKILRDTLDSSFFDNQEDTMKKSMMSLLYLDTLYVSNLMDEYDFLTKKSIFANNPFTISYYLKEFWPQGTFEIKENEIQKNYEIIQNILRKNNIIHYFLNTVKIDAPLTKNYFRQTNLTVPSPSPNKEPFINLVKVFYFLRTKLSMEIPYIKYQDQEWQNPYIIVYEDFIKQNKISKKILEKDWFPREKRDNEISHISKITFRIHFYDFEDKEVYTPITINANGSVDFNSTYKEDYHANLRSIKQIVDLLTNFITELNKNDYRLNNQIPESLKILVPSCNYLPEEDQIELVNIRFTFFQNFFKYIPKMVDNQIVGIDYNRLYEICRRFTPFINVVIGKNHLKKNIMYFVYKRVSNFKNKDEIFQFIDSLWIRGIRSEYFIQQEIQTNFFKTYQESLQLIHEWKLQQQMRELSGTDEKNKDGISVILQNYKLSIVNLKDIDTMNRTINFFIKIFSIYTNEEEYKKNKYYQYIMSDEEIPDIDLYESTKELSNAEKEFLEQSEYYSNTSLENSTFNFSNYIESNHVESANSNEIINGENTSHASAIAINEQIVEEKKNKINNFSVHLTPDNLLESSIRLDCADAIPELDTCKELCNDKSYILRRLQRYDLRLFRFQDDKDAKSKNYAKLCNANHDRQPIVISYDPEKNYNVNRESFTYSIRAGSNPEKQFWYICPKVWCPYCQLPIAYNDVFDVRKMRTSKDQTVCVTGTCPRGPHQVRIKTYNEGDDHLGGPVYPGYLPSEKHPDGLCMPCCFVENQLKNPKSPKFLRMKRCMGEEIMNSNIKKNLYILGHDKVPLDPERYGLMAVDLNNYFGSQCETGFLPTKHKCYLRKGVKLYLNQSFLSTILDIIREEKEGEMGMTMEEFREFLAERMTPKMFQFLSNGNLPKLFGYPEKTFEEALDSFQKYIRVNENITEEYIWDYLSQPGILFPEGVNIFIFYSKGLLCPYNQDYSEIYNTTRKSVFIIKYRQKQIYEPIYYIENNKKQWYFDFTNDMVKKTYDLLQRKCVPYYNVNWKKLWNDLQKMSTNSYKLKLNEESIAEYEPGNEELNLMETFVFLKQKNIITEKNISQIQQVVDTMNKVIAIVVPPPYHIFLPVRPSQLIIELPIAKSTLEPICVLSYEKTIDIYQKFIRMKLPYEIKSQASYNNNIIGIFLNTGRIILCTPLPITSKKINKKIPIIEINYNPVELERAIEENRMDKDDRTKQIDKWYFEQETYQRIRLELSKLLQKNKLKKEELMEIINDMYQSKLIKRNNIYQWLNTELANNIIEIENDTVDLSGDGQNPRKKQIAFINPNFRRTTIECTIEECRDDPHFEYDERTKKCYLRVMKRNLITDKLNLPIYYKMIVEELLNSNLKRREIINGLIPEILDKREIKKRKGELLFTGNYQVEIAKLFRDTKYQYIEKDKVYNDINPITKDLDQYLIFRNVEIIENLLQEELTTYWKNYFSSNYKVYKTPYQDWFNSLYLIFSRVYKEIRQQNILIPEIKKQFIAYIEQLTINDIEKMQLVLPMMWYKSKELSQIIKSDRSKTSRRNKDSIRNKVITKKNDKNDELDIEKILIKYYQFYNPMMKKIKSILDIKETILLDDYQPCLIDIYFLCIMYNINCIILNKKINKILPYEYQVFDIDKNKPYLLLYVEIDNDIIIYNQMKRDKYNLIPLIDLPRILKDHLNMRRKIQNNSTNANNKNRKNEIHLVDSSLKKKKKIIKQ
jgi:hypothetical protein